MTELPYRNNPVLRRKIILYPREQPDCTRFGRMSDGECETITAHTEEEFYEDIRIVPADAAVICFCTGREENVEKAMRMDAITGPVPVLTCSKSLNPEFIRKAVERGARRFLVCDMEDERIREIILEAIHDQGLRGYLESRWPQSDIASPHIRRVIDEIIHVFPHRMKVKEYAKRVGIDRGWLHKQCKRTFGIPFSTLLRRVRLLQALNLMQHTKLDNLEIAAELHYTEESSMAREFRKELGCNPNEARKLLADHTPEGLLH